MCQILFIANTVTRLVRLMVDEPDRVCIEIIETATEATLLLTVAPDDLGKVIGKQGRNAAALRVIVAAISRAAGQRTLPNLALKPGHRKTA